MMPKVDVRYLWLYLSVSSGTVKWKKWFLLRRPFIFLLQENFQIEFILNWYSLLCYRAEKSKSMETVCFSRPRNTVDVCEVWKLLHMCLHRFELLHLHFSASPETQVINQQVFHFWGTDTLSLRKMKLHLLPLTLCLLGLGKYSQHTILFISFKLSLKISLQIVID